MFCLSQEKFALINVRVLLLVELILIVKALAGIPVTVPSNGFPQRLWGQSLSPVFLCTLCASVYIHCTSVQYTVLVITQTTILHRIYSYCRGEQ